MDFGQTITNDAKYFLGSQGSIYTPSYSRDRSEFLNQYNPQLNLEQRADEMRREEENKSLQQAMKESQQNELARQTMSGIAGSGLGESMLGNVATQNQFALSEKEQRDLMEKEFARRAKVEQLKTQFASEEIQKMNKQFQKNMADFQRAFSEFRRTEEGKYTDEATRRQESMQAEYDSVIDKINKRMRKSSVGQRIASSGLGIAGAIGGALLLPGIGAVAGASLGASLGSSLGSGVGGLVGGSRSDDDIQRYIRAFGSYT